MRSRVYRVYADTSVYGGVFDQLYADASVAFFAQVEEGRLRLVISPLVQDELGPAPESVRQLFEEHAVNAENLDISPEAEALQLAYLEHNIVTPRYEADALHVALASAGHCWAIVSWNFRHIVQLDRIRQYNAVNRLLGYDELAIHTPPEVLRYED